ncbi:hypothetical protein PBCVCviKI_141L [Paramecium bursaria Chlorella virus CviKI]|nr:hypothetical protein PBCVCviKI_141L [Paramecium bursaria Chlorella virus CviKI]
MSSLKTGILYHFQINQSPKFKATNSKMNTIAFHKQMLSEIAHDIEYCLVEISRAEFRNVNQYTPGYMGFLDFENLPKEDQEYLKQSYAECHENHAYLMKMTEHLHFLRQRYTYLYEQLEGLKTISTLQLNGTLPAVTTIPIHIQDSNVYDESAFGENFDWIM